MDDSTAVGIANKFIVRAGFISVHERVPVSGVSGTVSLIKIMRKNGGVIGSILLHPQVLESGEAALVGQVTDAIAAAAAEPEASRKD